MEIWLLVMGIFFCLCLCLLATMWRKINRSRKALADLGSWEKNHPGFIASRAANAPSDSTSNPKTQQWLKLLWAGYQQNKPPVVDETVQREEEDLCGNDELIRTTSVGLIVLGILGTFIGLYQANPTDYH